MASSLLGFSTGGWQRNNTQYQPLTQAGTVQVNSTEALTQFEIARANLKIKNLGLHVYSSGTGGDSTLTSRINATGGGCSVVAGAAATGHFIDSAGSDTLASGDKWNTRMVTPAGGSTDLFGMVTAELETLSGPMAYVMGGQYNYLVQVAGQTHYVGLAGDLNNINGAETTYVVSHRVRAPGLARGLQCQIFQNDLSGSCVATLRVNGVDTALTFTVAAGDTTHTIDSTHSVRINRGDLINLKIVTAAGTGQIAFSGLALWVDSTDEQFDFSVAGVGNFSSSTGALAYYLPIIGSIGTTISTSATNWKIKLPFATRLGRLRVGHTSVGNHGNTATVALRVNGVASALSVGIASLEAAGFAETSPSTYVDVLTTDELDLSITSAGTWQSVVHSIALTGNYNSAFMSPYGQRGLHC